MNTNKSPYIRYSPMNIKKIPLLVAFMFLFAHAALSQSTMSDSQVMQYILQENQRGTSRDRIVTNLIEKGVTIEQIKRIRTKAEKQQGGLPGAKDLTGASAVPESRLRKNNSEDRKAQSGTRNLRSRDRKPVREGELSPQQLKSYRNNRELEYLEGIDGLLPDTLGYDGYNYEEDERLKVFGRNIFNNPNLSFEPNMNIATPQDYRLGAGDAVYIDVWGASQERYSATVSPEGEVVIEGFGPVQVDGLTVQEANARLRSTLGARFSSSQVKLSVGQTRTISINVMGEVVAPGTYTLSAFSTVFHALYMAGGTNEIGTLRNIKVFRNGRQISTCDIYDYMLNGNMKGNVRLASGDVVVVGPYDCLVNVTGKVKRPMFYEMRKTESVGKLIEYAGGFAGDAYTQQVCLVRKAGGELSVYSIDEFERNKFQLADGDSVSVDSTLRRFKNMVEVKGAVRRAGMYQMDGNITTVRQLIAAAGGVSEDAILSRGIMHRRKEDRSLEVLALNLKGIMEHTEPDVVLRNEDALFVPSRKEMMEDLTLHIEGEVRYPGIYEYADNTTLEDFILQAGGLTDAASVVKVDVMRRVRNNKAESGENIVAKSYNFALKEGFVVDGKPGFTLEPFDEVYVRRSPGYVEQQHVAVNGEVAFSGTYVLTSKGMRLSDLVKMAGGLTKEAYAEGARLERTLTTAERMKQESMLKLLTNGDSIDVRKLEIGNTKFVGINLDKALANPGDNEWDIVLEEGDQLIIPQYSNTVTIGGEVMYPNTVAYKKGQKLKHYIDQSGGYSLNAKSSRVFAVNMNGTVTRVRSAKDIQPGCNILVPAKRKRTGMNIGEILSMGTMVGTLGAVLVNLIK